MSLIGRERELEQLRQAIAQGGHVLISGRAGIGKSALMRTLAEQLPQAVVVPTGTPKLVLLAALEQAHQRVGLRVPEGLLPATVKLRAQQRGFVPWQRLSYPLRRLPLDQQATILRDSLQGRNALVLLDSLEWPPTLVEAFSPLFDVAQIIAAMDADNRRSRIERLLWRFQIRIELKPLTLEASSRLAEQALERFLVRFAEEGVRDRFLRHVARESGGVPAAILGMVESAAAEPEVTPALAVGVSHEAGIRYLDLTPVLLLGLFVFMALRYIARGLDSEELFVLSGVASAGFMALRLVIWNLRGR